MTSKQSDQTREHSQVEQILFLFIETSEAAMKLQNLAI